jgi:uncharacterized membrane protein YeaQ/YmgE (transglycosylase-associated protein family)
MLLLSEVNLLATAPNWVAWIILGAIAGFLTKKFMGGSEGYFKDTLLGIVGALMGAIIAGFFFPETLDFLASVVVAMLGAIALVATWRMIARERPSHV